MLLEGVKGGGVESVSSKVELEEKAEPNKLAFSREEMATDPSGRK